MYKCINKKDSFKNLTINKDYEGEEVGNFIEVINDSNVKARYDKKYFEVVRPRPRTRTLTCRQFIDEFITFELRTTNNIHEIIIRSDNYICNLYINSTLNSCGIKFIDGMDLLEDFINARLGNMPDNVVLDNDEGADSELFYEIMKKAILEFERLSGMGHAFYMFTTNDPSRDIFNTLTQHSIKTEEEENPNSGNDIAIWVCSRTQLGI